MDKKEIMIGDISGDDLMKAQDTVRNAVVWIASNFDHADEQMKADIVVVFSLLALDDMMQRPVRMTITKKIREHLERKSFESERLGETVAKA